MEVKKIYLVTIGDYSDYHVERVFSSEELAKQWISKAPHGFFSAEEVILDDLKDPPREYYKIKINYDTEEFISDYQTYSIESDVIKWTAFPSEYTETVFDTYDNRNVFYTMIDTNDLNTAIKIASERLAVMKAQEKGL